MAAHEIETQWMGKMQFNALINGHTVIMDAPEKAGGEDNGPIPKPFVLTALSGCTGMDVVSHLRKHDHAINGLSIKVTGELSKQQPIEYTAIHLLYEIEGDEQLETAAIEAIRLSQEKYCGVSNMLKKALPVSWEIWYNHRQVFSTGVSTCIPV
jgi:putative redox protein